MRAAVRRALPVLANAAGGCEVQDRVRAMLAKQPLDLGPLPNVDVLEDMARMSPNVDQGIEVAGVGQRIDVDDRGIRLVDELTDERGADEAGAARHEKRAHASRETIRPPPRETKHTIR